MTAHSDNTNQKPMNQAVTLLRGNGFWVAVLMLAALSVGCFGFAGIQLKPVEQQTPPPPPSRHSNDGELKKLRSPILFERGQPERVILST